MSSNTANSIENKIRKKEMISKDEFKNFFTKIRGITGKDGDDGENEQITNKGKSFFLLFNHIPCDFIKYIFLPVSVVSSSCINCSPPKANPDCLFNFLSYLKPRE